MDGGFGKWVGNGDCGVENMEIWIIVIQMLLSSGVFVGLRSVTFALRSPSYGQWYAQGGKPVGKMKIKRMQSSFRAPSLLGVAEEEKQEDLQRDDVEQNWRDQFYVG